MKKSINRIASLCLAFCLLLTIMPGFSQPVAAASGVWNGKTADTTWYTEHTEDTEFTLTTAEQLAGLASLVNDGTTTCAGISITLGDDIMLNSAGSTTNTWMAIGSITHSFQGNFDGNGHTVSGICINTTTDYQGLFGYVGTGGTIRNVGVIDSSITGKQWIGGVVGYFAGSEILNCYNTGAVSGKADSNLKNVGYIGGVAGEVAGAITGCHNTGKVNVNDSDCSWDDFIGGVVGFVKGTVENCYNAGQVSAYGRAPLGVGGVAGGNSGTSMTDCYNTGSIESEQQVGGIIGFNDKGSIVKRCYNNGEVKVNADLIVVDWGARQLGGVAGYNFGTITECYNTGAVAGAFYSGEDVTHQVLVNKPSDGVGGVVGGNGGTVINCFNQGKVCKGTDVGGVVGLNEGGGVTQDCYNRGSIGQADDTINATDAMNDTKVGGVIGSNGGAANACYSTGTVTGSAYVGGAIGYFNSSSSCYWDSSVFTGNNGLGVGKTTDEMKSPEFAALLNQDTQTYTLRWVPDSNLQNYGYPVTDLYEFWTNYAAAFAGGTGKSADDPYLISNAQQLAYLSKTVNAGTNYTGQYFKLTADIDLGDLDLGGKVWTSIGGMTSPTVYKPFNGTFDGDNRSISNMYIDNGDYQGLFGCVGAGGIIKNVAVIDCYIRGLSYVGGIAGYNFGTIMNCYTTGTIAGRIIVTVPASAIGSNVGGVAGYNAGGKITNCYNYASVSGNQDVGGVVGFNYLSNNYVFGIVSNCCNTGSVKGTCPTGGVVGQSIGTVNNCCNTGPVGGTYMVGGVVGYIWQDMASVTNCFNTGSVTESGTGVPADNIIVGTGGVVGYSDAFTIEGSSYVASIRNCYNKGAISGRKNVGGVVGTNIWPIHNCYSTGKVSGTTNVGALFGDNWDTATYCYWDSTINSDLPGMASVGTLNNGSLGTTCSGYSTTDMKSADFAALLNANKGSYNSWIAVSNDYPTLGEGIPYTVVFDKNGGNTEAYPIIAATTYGGVVYLPTTDPTRANYTFAGWNTQADGTGTAFTASTAVTANITVHAQWTAIPPTTYTVAFDKNGGDIEASPVTATTTYGGVVYLPTTDPTRAHYTFAGWNTQADGNGTAFTASTAVTANITVYAQWTAIPPTTYTVTFDKNGGDTEASPVTAATTYGGVVYLPTTDPTRTHYTFASWNTQADGNGNAFTASTAVTTNITVYAQWLLNSSDGGGGSTNSNPAAGTITTTTADGKTIITTAATATTGTDGVSLTIPLSSIGTLSGSSVTSLTVSTPIVTITFDMQAITGIQNSASGDITISIREADTSGLSDSNKALIGGRPVYDFTVTSGGTTISSFGGGTATVSIPYTPASGEDTSKIVVYYISGSGELVMVPDCVYNAATGMVTFKTTHFSSYAVGYNDVSFKDVSGWYEDYVSYLAAREIVSGTGGGKFSPDATITRAEFATILARLSGNDLSGYTASAFSDVSVNNWYFAAVQWAYENDIAAGSDGKFDPNASITREQMAVMLYRYTKYTGDIVSNVEGMSIREFLDYENISDWAMEAIQWAANNSIVSGNDDGSFAPKDSATRAEAAKMIAVLMQKMIG